MLQRAGRVGQRGCLRVCLTMTSFGNASSEKMYKGSKHDSAWNHDLLWKLRVKNENTLIGIAPDDNKPVHVQRPVRIDTARSEYVRQQLESAHGGGGGSRAPSASSAMPREILELEQQIRDEIAKRERIETKLMALLETLRTEEGSSPLPPQQKSGQNTKRVLDKISAAVASARRTARGGGPGLPQVS